MRILVWHGWLLGGSGANVYAAKIVETWRREGHDVLLLCQEPHPEQFPFLDGWGPVTDAPVPRPLPAVPAPGRAVLLRPDIGDLLPVFVYDDYEGFRVKTFVDLTEEELDGYLKANVTAVRSAAAWHRPDLVITGHALPGPAVARRALEALPYVAKVHGSDIEYAMRAQPRYIELAREGLEGAAGITGSSQDVIDRLVDLVPSVADRAGVVAPGVDVERFRPMPRREALLRTAALLEEEPARERGRTEEVTRESAEAVHRGDADALDRLAGRYDQTAPDAAAPGRLRALAGYEGPLVGYIGKLIPQKGVDLLLAALPHLHPAPRALIVGFGTFREWLEALVHALDAGDGEAVRFLRDRFPAALEAAPDDLDAARGLAGHVTFTGRLDHRYAPTALAALDVLVVPSVLDEAFGMVAVEGAAAGAVPVVARHSGLVEIAGALETEIGQPGLLSFEPGDSAVPNLVAALERLLAVPTEERRALGRRLSAHARERWGWDRTARGLLDAAGVRPG